MGDTSSPFFINFTLLNQSINRYVPIPLLFFGGIGNVLNILVFTRRAFHQNICATYFLGSTIFDSFAILVGLVPRVLMGYDIDPTQYSSILCKLRFFISYHAGYTAAWLTSLACVERYLSSSVSVNQRELMTMKRVYRSMIVVIVTGVLIFGEQFYCIDINQQLWGAPQSCYQLKQNIQCQIVDSLLQLVFEILTPAMMMIAFGLLTLKNVRHKHRRVTVLQTINRKIPLIVTHHVSIQQPVTPRFNANLQTAAKSVDRRGKKRNAQLSTMLLVQVAVFVVSSFPISVYKLYSVATIYDTKTTLRTSIENTIFNISVISLFLNNTITFYINTLCGTTFRKELIKLFRLS